jgi:hypothetical protein
MTGTNGSIHGLGPEELRDVVRSLLREVLPAGVLNGTTSAGAAGSGGLDAPVEVVLENDADLTAFLRRVAAICDDPGRRAALRDGRHGFRLAKTGAARSAGGPGSPHGSVLRVEQGAVTERTVVKAAAEGARLVLGRRAVLTPLARDKARTLGVEIEKER